MQESLSEQATPAASDGAGGGSRLLFDVSHVDLNARIADNLAYASVPMSEILDMARRAAKAKPDALIGWCTNFPTAVVAVQVEAETGIPFYDATSIIVWKALRLLDVETKHISGWGRVFALD